MRAAVVCRHPSTLRAVTQALGAAGLGLRQVIAPGLLPRSQPGEFEVVLVDLDIDAASPPSALLGPVTAACPETPIICVAGISAKPRLVESLRAPAVIAIVPKLGSWLESSPSGAPIEGPDEQELGVSLRRLTTRAPMPYGPASYLAGGTPIEERLIAPGGHKDKEKDREKDDALAALQSLGQRLGLSEEKLRRVEGAAEELLMNALHDAPKTARVPAPPQPVRLRFGADGRSLALSVHDRFGSITREAVVGHVGRVLEAGGPRPRPAGSSTSGGAGLGLVLAFGAANQLIVQCIAGKFTEVTAVVHIAGSNRAALARGSALHLYL